MFSVWYCFLRVECTWAFLVDFITRMDVLLGPVLCFCIKSSAEKVLLPF